MTNNQVQHLVENPGYILPLASQNDHLNFKVVSRLNSFKAIGETVLILVTK